MLKGQMKGWNGHSPVGVDHLRCGNCPPVHTCQLILDRTFSRPLSFIPELCPLSSHDDYWRVLWEKGHLTRADLEGFGKPLKGVEVIRERIQSRLRIISKPPDLGPTLCSLSIVIFSPAAWPMHLPHLIPAFQHFLWILKVTHSGADMDTAFTMAQVRRTRPSRWHR